MSRTIRQTALFVILPLLLAMAALFAFAFAVTFDDVTLGMMIGGTAAALVVTPLP
ncbi:hypothetical protein [Jiella marina]|uniref:hypothetical protein n=1 Tax=Jiella sp. LLJ827 TaxID=2917712 RepID=UPI00210096F6|nr:hypothetical protein [Jiella sp. LLJ827]MCQ0986706.1 hypothetical protein [Jiella sp. LLJ827]